jgi:hypothetical protein
VTAAPTSQMSSTAATTPTTRARFFTTAS